MGYKNIIRIAVVTAAILLVPLIAMQFSTGVDWDIRDFTIMGVLIFGTGLAYELISKTSGKNHKLAVGVGLAVAFLLVWAELAVGIFGSPFAGS